MIDNLLEIQTSKDTDKCRIVKDIVSYMDQNGYEIVDINIEKPWGGCLRLNTEDADRFIEEFFPLIDSSEIKINNSNNLSPKILLISPGARLSWQYHNHRAECWNFLTDGGAYMVSDDDDETDPIVANSGDFVQINVGQRHRLIGSPDKYVVLAEIWQHTDDNNMSDEDDIIRISDDYSR